MDAADRVKRELQNSVERGRVRISGIIRNDLYVVGEDWWLERGEYDGSEWWEFKRLPECPPRAIPTLKTLLEQSLRDFVLNL